VLCIFSDCSTSGTHRRAVCADAQGPGCHTFSLNTTSSVNCLSAKQITFCSAYITSSANGRLEIGELSAIACTGVTFTICFTCFSFPSESTSVAESVNSSGNAHQPVHLAAFQNSTSLMHSFSKRPGQLSELTRDLLYIDISCIDRIVDQFRLTRIISAWGRATSSSRKSSITSSDLMRERRSLLHSSGACSRSNR
jgi:hypothetical protein